jgi:hypothetical protein
LKGRGAQSWVEITNINECTQEIGHLQSVNSHEHLLQSPFTAVFRIRIRIHRIHMFLGHKDPDPLVRGMDPDPDPTILKQK